MRSAGKTTTVEIFEGLTEPTSGEVEVLGERWRRDVLATLDDALSETADLAQHQMDLAGRMRRGEASPGLRGAQAALREGADRVLRRLQSAAGKNALVSPQVGATLGLSRLRMTEAIDQLQRAMPNTGAAADLADLVIRQSEQIAKAVSFLEKPDHVMGYCVEINRLENEADRVAREALGCLFESDKDPIALIKIKELYEVLERASDKAEDVANVLESVVLTSA